MDLSRLGVFCFLDPLPGAALGPLLKKVERLGYSGPLVRGRAGPREPVAGHPPARPDADARDRQRHRGRLQPRADCGGERGAGPERALSRSVHPGAGGQQCRGQRASWRALRAPGRVHESQPRPDEGGAVHGPGAGRGGPGRARIVPATDGPAGRGRDRRGAHVLHATREDGAGARGDRAPGNGCAPNRPSSWRATPCGLGQRPASTWRSTSRSRTTRSCWPRWDSPLPTSPTAGAIAWSTPSWPGEPRRPCARESPPTSPRAPRTSACFPPACRRQPSAGRGRPRGPRARRVRGGSHVRGVRARARRDRRARARARVRPLPGRGGAGRDTSAGDAVFPERRGAAGTAHANSFISASACSSQNVMSISRYIVVAVVRCSWACSRLPVRR